MKFSDHVSNDTKREMHKKANKQKSNKNEKPNKDPLKKKYSDGFIKSLMWDGDIFKRGKGGSLRNSHKR